MCIIEINSGECYDTLIREMYVQPTISITSQENEIYFDDFEGSTGTWIARSTDNSHCSWQYGLSGHFTADTLNPQKS